MTCATLLAPDESTFVIQLSFSPVPPQSLNSFAYSQVSGDVVAEQAFEVQSTTLPYTTLTEVALHSHESQQQTYLHTSSSSTILTYGHSSRSDPESDAVLKGRRDTLSPSTMTPVELFEATKLMDLPYHPHRGLREHESPYNGTSHSPSQSMWEHKEHISAPNAPDSVLPKEPGSVDGEHIREEYEYKTSSHYVNFFQSSMNDSHDLAGVGDQFDLPTVALRATDVFEAFASYCRHHMDTW